MILSGNCEVTKTYLVKAGGVEPVYARIGVARDNTALTISSHRVNPNEIVGSFDTPGNIPFLNYLNDNGEPMYFHYHISSAFTFSVELFSDYVELTDSDGFRLHVDPKRMAIWSPDHKVQVKLPQGAELNYMNVLFSEVKNAIISVDGKIPTEEFKLIAGPPRKPNMLSGPLTLKYYCEPDEYCRTCYFRKKVVLCSNPKDPEVKLLLEQ